MKILNVVAITLFLGSCTVAEPVFISNDNMAFKGLKDSIFYFTVDANVYNPTNYNYELRELLFDVNYDDAKMGSGSLINPQFIKVKDTVALAITGNLSLSQLHKKHKQILAQDKVNFYFTGKAFAVHPLKKIRKSFEVSVPYDAKSFITDNVLSSDLVLNEIEIEKLNPFANLNPLRSYFRLNVHFYNSQSFDFKIEKIEISLKSKQSDKVFLEGVLDSLIHAPSFQKIKVPLDMESDNLNVLQNFGSSFFTKDANKFIGSGFVVVRIENYDFQIPFSKEFEIEGNPFGNLDAVSNTTNLCFISRSQANKSFPWVELQTNLYLYNEDQKK
ncbi:hypothetical protein U1E44_03480 [Arenibacter sp. GZD96]|uniref:hypothetical protein n=1 Tax=Aurantibrevibacter litoralis TaxID=3106030 RepID=UPI002AFFCFCF|nr:hypothetical protein [Arenibacter sp. GZD-96]MEA1785140.1 hypothetical protein [Arenibacter sp. GZD-96]